jgi:hypothetical protein
MSHHPHRSARTACIIDGDNVAIGGQVPVPDVARVLGQLSALTMGRSVTFAMQQRLAVQYMTAYADLGWAIRFASMAPDAADVELLDAAADYLAHDVTDLLVVSGDHAFADLAGHARLHVCAYRSSLSKRLQLAATSVTYLDDLIAPIAA